jgi:hypothetical protein
MQQSSFLEIWVAVMVEKKFAEEQQRMERKIAQQCKVFSFSYFLGK